MERSEDSSVKLLGWKWKKTSTSNARVVEGFEEAASEWSREGLKVVTFLPLLILNLLLLCDKPIFDVMFGIRKVLLSCVERLSNWMPRGDVPDRILLRELEFVKSKLAVLWRIVNERMAEYPRNFFGHSIDVRSVSGCISVSILELCAIFLGGL